MRRDVRNGIQIVGAAVLALGVIAFIVYQETRPTRTDEDRVRAAWERTALFERLKPTPQGELFRKARIKKVRIDGDRATVWCADDIFFSFRRVDGDWELWSSGRCITSIRRR